MNSLNPNFLWFSHGDEVYKKVFDLYKECLVNRLHLVSPGEEGSPGALYRTETLMDWLYNTSKKNTVVCAVSYLGEFVLFVSVTDYINLGVVHISQLQIVKERCPSKDFIIDVTSELFKQIREKYPNRMFYGAVKKVNAENLAFFRNHPFFQMQLMEDKYWYEEFHPYKIREDWISFSFKM